MRDVAAASIFKPFLTPTRWRHIVDLIRSGAWLTRARLRFYPLVVGGVLALALAALLITSHNSRDLMGRPLGGDFSGIWIAGQEVRAGHSTQPYDNAAHAAAQGAVFGPADSFLPWPYPPYFLVIAGVLAGLPYLLAVAAWEGLPLLGYLAAIRTALGRSGLGSRDVLIASLAFPAVTINLLNGQNGFFTAGLLGLGALALPRRPLLAGALFGCLACKPQFGLAIPIALVAGRYWRTIGTTIATITLMTVATLIAFGSAPWIGFFGNTGFVRHVILQSGGIESWKLQSVFAAARLVGLPTELACALQIATTLAVLAGLAIVWRGDVDDRLKAASLMVASLLATPYGFDYDMVVLGPAIAALVAHGLDRGFAPFGKSLIATTWAMPLFARAAGMSVGLPIGVLTMMVLFGHIVLQRSAMWPGLSPKSAQ